MKLSGNAEKIIRNIQEKFGKSEDILVTTRVHMVYPIEKWFEVKKELELLGISADITPALNCIDAVISFNVNIVE